MDYVRLNKIDLANAIARGDAEAIAECDRRDAAGGSATGAVKLILEELNNNVTNWNLIKKRVKEKMPDISDAEMTAAVSEGHKRYERRDAEKDEKKPGAPPYEHKYNKEAVQQAINKDKRIKPAEASAIHRLLKGRHDADASYSAQDMGDGEFLVRRKKDGAQLEVKASSEENAIYKAKQAGASAWG